MSGARETTGTHAPARLRILIAKLGLDGHDLGARYVVRMLRNAGHEVIYTGLHTTPEAVAQAAADEGVDVVGVSILSGAHLELCGKLIERMKQVGAGDVPVVVGGVILPEDVEALLGLGVREVFPSTEPEERIRDFFDRLAGEHAAEGDN
ncbi:MAG: methylmalonyl-CoA mutase [Deltaproteobacteria bacterium]|nr:MAG: methylmalonyl-CoA mutase [Deltaproteobacteria bacterium]